MSTTTTTVAIADDQPLVRSGLRMIVEGEPDLRIVGEAADGATAVDLVAAESPDVLLLDVQMPGVDGLAAMEQIAAGAASTRVLMLTTFDLDEYVYRAMRAGASGFLLKDMQGEDIVSCIRQVARGADALLAPALTRRLLDRFAASPLRHTASRLDRLTNREVEVLRLVDRYTGAPQPMSPTLDALTARELDVLRLIARGLSNAEIAHELFIGETTVKTHVARVLMKLGLRDRVQAVVVAYESGLT